MMVQSERLEGRMWWGQDVREERPSRGQADKSPRVLGSHRRV